MIYLLAGLVKWGIQNLELFGRLSLIASCGAYGTRETLKLSLGQSVPAFKLTFLQTLFEWMKASNLISAHSVAEMLDICSV